MSHIKPCPFCGASGARLGVGVLDTGLEPDIDPYRVECEICNAAGPFSQQYQGAIDNWNTRVPNEQTLRQDGQADGDRGPQRGA